MSYVLKNFIALKYWLRKNLKTEDIPIIPMAGDIVFCCGNKFIKSGQFTAAVKHKHVTHVAIMASSAEIAEAMLRKKISVQSFTNWDLGRSSFGKHEKRIVLRFDKAIEKTHDIQRRIAFYLNEPYRIPSIQDWTLPGRSICSSFVAKTLATAEVIPTLPGRNILLPGTLFKTLKKLGFREIPSKSFHIGAHEYPEHSSFASAQEILGILDKILKETYDARQQAIGWISIVEKDLQTDPFTYLGVWIDIADGDIVPFGKKLAKDAHVILECIKMLQSRGPKNWERGTEVHFKQIEVLRVIASDYYNLVQIFSQTLETGYLQKMVGVKPKIPEKKIYDNIGYYLKSTELVIRSTRSILGST